MLAGLVAALISFKIGVNICLFLTILFATLLLPTFIIVRSPATSFRRYIENATGMHCTLNGKTCQIEGRLTTKLPESFTSKKEEYLKLSTILDVVATARIVIGFVGGPILAIKGALSLSFRHDSMSLVIPMLMLAAFLALILSNHTLSDRQSRLIEGAISQLETMISIPDSHEEFGRPRIFSWSASNDEITIIYGYTLSL